MRAALALIFALALTGVSSGDARSQGSCFGYHVACRAVCTPDRTARYYAGSLRRCTASCEPRYHQCIRSGAWLDLEVLRGGGWERGSIF